MSRSGEQFLYRNLAKLQGAVALIRGGRLNNLGLPGRNFWEGESSCRLVPCLTLAKTFPYRSLGPPRSWLGRGTILGPRSADADDRLRGIRSEMKQLYDRTNNIFRRACGSPGGASATSQDGHAFQIRARPLSFLFSKCYV